MIKGHTHGAKYDLPAKTRLAMRSFYWSPDATYYYNLIKWYNDSYFQVVQ